MSIISLCAILTLGLAASSANGWRVAKSCEYQDTIPLIGSTLYADNTVKHNTLTYNEDQWGEYGFVMEGNVKITHRRGCICQVTECVRLCCPWNHVYDKEKKSCVSLAYTNARFSILINVREKGITEFRDLTQDDDYNQRFVYGNPQCKTLKLENPQNGKTLLHNNGIILHQSKDKFTWLDETKYCIDVNYDGSTSLLFCQNSDSDPSFADFTTISFSVSLPFLLMTLLVYTIMPQLRDINGKSVMFYLIGLLLSNVSMIIIRSPLALVDPYCLVFTCACYFGYMLTLFWMNVMCIDIWRTSSKPMIRIDDFQKYCFYLCYACGMPLLLLAVFLFNADSYLNVEGEVCSLLKYNNDKFHFLYIPFCVLTSVNMFLYFLTLLKTRHQSQENFDAPEGFNQTNSGAKMVTTWLLIVMTITWSLDIMMWCLPNDNKFFIVVEVLSKAWTLLHGFFIFMLVVLQIIIGKPITERKRRKIEKKPRFGVNNQQSAPWVNIGHLKDHGMDL